jgi:hypothetical protein
MALFNFINVITVSNQFLACWMDCTVGQPIISGTNNEIPTNFEK